MREDLINDSVRREYDDPIADAGRSRTASTVPDHHEPVKVVHTSQHVLKVNWNYNAHCHPVVKRSVSRPLLPRVRSTCVVFHTLMAADNACDDW
jgi:hypothetical protein